MHVFPGRRGGKEVFRHIKQFLGSLIFFFILPEVFNNTYYLPTIGPLKWILACHWYFSLCNWPVIGTLVCVIGLSLVICIVWRLFIYRHYKWMCRNKEVWIKTVEQTNMNTCRIKKITIILMKLYQLFFIASRSF